MRKKKVLFSVAFSLLITVLAYLQNTYPYPLFDKLDVFSKLEPVLGQQRPFPEDVLLVSTSHDKMIVQTDKGNEPVSDRQKLARFLEIVDSVGTYKMVFYDLLLEEEYVSEYDSALVSVLSKIPRLVMVKSMTSKGKESSMQDSSRLHRKAAFNDYGYTRTHSGFTRYQFVQNGEASVALKMYRNLGSPEDTIVKAGPLYFSHSRLCSGSPLIVIDRIMCSFDEVGEPLITRCNLGRDYLALPIGSLSSEIKDKVIIIGDFDKDVHGTYVGKVSGSMLAYSAYAFLYDGKHLIRFSTFLSFFLLYFLLSLAIISDWGPKLIDRFIRGRIGVFFFSFISYSIILLIVSLFEFRIHGIITSTFLPSMLLSLLSMMVKKGVIRK